ncbi:multicopper oxidase family protein [Amycolatopsis nigrescens]|uniref:multicopper oxidase family protein n=1 Tax=Amycolatopsis nigrescens TaxID=381445 RepID=UPI00036E9DE7|nr:multicopper oxidase family protein [Amycolatopsis nigrescens]
MDLRRRDALRLFGLGAVALGPMAAVAGCSTAGASEARLLPSEVPLPQPFTSGLRIPSVLQPAPDGGDKSTDFYDMVVRPADVQILPGLSTTIWGYDGQFPGPTLRARRGRRVVLRQSNELPVPIATHLHGGRTPPEADGYPTDLTMPAAGGFVPHHMNDPMAKVTTGSRSYEYPFEQRASTLWYHDHRMDFTGPQVWRGLAGFCLVGDEEEDALPLPKGDKDIPLMICDRSFGADGQFRYPALDATLREAPGVQEEYGGGVLGDVILVNGSPWPVHEVAGTRYRFRLLNASNARRYELALEAPSGSLGFVQIGSDGGLLAAPVPRQTITLAPAERVDVVIDFGGVRIGDAITMVNKAAGGAQGQIMRFLVARAETDDSAIPPRLSEIERLDPAQAVVTREFSFKSGEVGGHSGWTVNENPFDPSRMDARPALDSIEVWRISTDVEHPIHLHLVHFQVLSVGGKAVDIPGWKDTLDLGAVKTAEIIMRFSGYRGRYVFHCHNLEHEDMAMMGNFEVV